MSGTQLWGGRKSNFHCTPLSDISASLYLFFENRFSIHLRDLCVLVNETMERLKNIALSVLILILILILRLSKHCPRFGVVF